VSSLPDIQAAAALLRDRLSAPPQALLVLGSGLGHLADAVADPVVIPFQELPGFPPSGVEGHDGRYVAGELRGRQVLIQSGRYHVYEGHPLEVVAAPVRTAAALGLPRIFLTNAAGGVNPELDPGDVVLLRDHINFMARTPLMGPTREGEVRFPDMSEPYDASLRALALRVAEEEGIALREGVYAALTGPSFETAAEVRMLGMLGADVVGMSTVPEVLVARARGIPCMALSMVTNKGTGLTSQPLSHREVQEVGLRAGRDVGRILEGVVALLPPHSTDAK
jgi:purine-nucleoside phosphorylase